METLMAGAAAVEIFLASVGIAWMLAKLALFSMLWLMQDAGSMRKARWRPVPRPATQRLQTAMGSLAMAHVQMDERRRVPSRAR